MDADAAFRSYADLEISLDSIELTGMRIEEKQIHIGRDLKYICDLNIGDFITGSNSTKEVVCPSGIGIENLVMKDVFCVVCATDEEISIDSSISLLKDSETLSDEDLEKVQEYQPRLSPGFRWNYEGNMRTICINCIFESSFDFSVKQRLQKYQESGNTNSQIREMQSQISQLTNLVNMLVSKM